MLIQLVTDQEIFKKIRAFTHNDYVNRGTDVLPNRAWQGENLLLMVDDYTRCYALDLTTSKFMDQIKAL